MTNKLIVCTAMLGISFMLATCARTANSSLPSTNNAWPVITYFPIGVFEDANILNGDAAKFETMLHNLESHGLDSVMFTNNFVSRDALLLDVSDGLGFNVFMLPAGDLNDGWWSSDVSEDIETARSVAKPIVHRFGSHPSFKGYIVKDEPERGYLNKVTLMTRALHELDSSRPAMPILVGIDRVRPIFDAAQPAVMLIDVYPVGYSNAIGDFTLTGLGYYKLDFVSYIRLVTQHKPADTPLWIILQAHRFGDGGRFSLREPWPTEVRAQNWLAIGEGATGIFWFVYSSQQGWVGLADNPTLLKEVSGLAHRVRSLRSLLMELQKVEDKFTVAGDQKPYVSTLANPDRTKVYVVAVNTDCERSQKLSLDSARLSGRLRDVETSQSYAMGEPIVFQPGDGKLFELVEN